MSQNTVEINQNSQTVSIADIGLYSIDVVDNTLGTSVDVTTQELSNTGADITVVTETNTIIPDNPNVTVQISSEPYNAVHVNIDVANEVTVTDNIAMAPITNNSPLIGDSNGHFGLGLGNPKYQLELSQDLFAPIISSSKLEVTGDGSDNIFLVKLNDSAGSKFVINLEGVTLLGAFSQTPTHVSGGMFYSSSGDFYLG
tara:strand:- start:1265 stop:1861 length:597 start_codon:yes stop_codon:yes gene_type:complete